MVGLRFNLYNGMKSKPISISLPMLGTKLGTLISNKEICVFKRKQNKRKNKAKKGKQKGKQVASINKKKNKNKQVYSKVKKLDSAQKQKNSVKQFYYAKKKRYTIKLRSSDFNKSKEKNY